MVTSQDTIGRFSESEYHDIESGKLLFSSRRVNEALFVMKFHRIGRRTFPTSFVKPNRCSRLWVNLPIISVTFELVSKKFRRSVVVSNPR